MAYGRLSHARGPTVRLPTIYTLNHQISLLTLNRSVDSAVRPLGCSRMYTPCIRIHHMVSPECRMSSPPTSETNTVNPEKLLLIVMTDRKGTYITPIVSDLHPDTTNHQISLLTLNRSVDSAVRPLVCSRIYTPCIRIHHIVSPECRMSSPPTSETQSIQKSYC